MYIYIYVYSYLFIYLFIYFSIYLFLYIFMCVYMYISVCVCESWAWFIRHTYKCKLCMCVRALVQGLYFKVAHWTLCASVCASNIHNIHCLSCRVLYEFVPPAQFGSFSVPLLFVWCVLCVCICILTRRSTVELLDFFSSDSHSFALLYWRWVVWMSHGRLWSCG